MDGAHFVIDNILEIFLPLLQFGFLKVYVKPKLVHILNLIYFLCYYWICIIILILTWFVFVHFFLAYLHTQFVMIFEDLLDLFPFVDFVSHFFSAFST